MRRSVAIALLIGACSPFAAASDASAPPPVDLDAAVVDAAPRIDASVPPEVRVDPSCAGDDLYCERFTDRNSLDELGATEIRTTQGSLAFVGDVATTGRALQAKGVVSGTTMTADLRFDFASAPPPKMTLAYALTLEKPSFANLALLTFDAPGASYWMVYHYTRDGNVYLSEYQYEPPIFHDTLLGTISDAKPHRVKLSVDLVNKVVFGSLDGAPASALDLTVPAGLTGWHLLYGVYSDSWIAPDVSVIYDDVRVVPR